MIPSFFRAGVGSSWNGRLILGAHAQVPKNCRKLLRVKRMAFRQVQNLTSVFCSLLFADYSKPLSQKVVKS